MKTKIEIKSIFGKVLFEFEKENNSLKETLIAALKSRANLRYADLSGANFSCADLSGANLRYANFSYADLSDADLSGADLRDANLDKRYIQIACIGSAKRMTTYCFEDDKIWCGCFTGTLKEFEIEVKNTHNDNPQYLAEYLGFINYIESLIKKEVKNAK